MISHIKGELKMKNKFYVILAMALPLSMIQLASCSGEETVSPDESNASEFVDIKFPVSIELNDARGGDVDARNLADGEVIQTSVQALDDEYNIETTLQIDKNDEVHSRGVTPIGGDISYCVVISGSGTGTGVHTTYANGTMNNPPTLNVRRGVMYNVWIVTNNSTDSIVVPNNNDPIGSITYSDSNSKPLYVGRSNENAGMTNGGGIAIPVQGPIDANDIRTKSYTLKHFDSKLTVKVISGDSNGETVSVESISKTPIDIFTLHLRPYSTSIDTYAGFEHTDAKKGEEEIFTYSSVDKAYSCYLTPTDYDPGVGYTPSLLIKKIEVKHSDGTPKKVFDEKKFSIFNLVRHSGYSYVLTIKVKEKS